MGPYRTAAPQPTTPKAKPSRTPKPGDMVRVRATAKTNAGKIGRVWFRDDAVYCVEFLGAAAGLHFASDLVIVDT